MLEEFHWVVAGLLAGSARPGLLRPVEDDMAALRGLGIRLVVTLTEDPLEPPASRYGLRGLHFPIDDMGIPTPRSAAGVCREVKASLDRREAVLLHCKAGLGRTGTLLACCLVSLGRSADEAVSDIRRACRAYIQTDAQRDFVRHFEEFLLGEG